MERGSEARKATRGARARACAGLLLFCFLIFLKIYLFILVLFVRGGSVSSEPHHLAALVPLEDGNLLERDELEALEVERFEHGPRRALSHRPRATPHQHRLNRFTFGIGLSVSSTIIDPTEQEN